MSDRIDEHRRKIKRSLGEPPEIEFPSGWTISESWTRAQTEDAVISPTNPIEYAIKLGSGDFHRTEFFIYGGKLRASCNCPARGRSWCAHIARLYLKWIRHDLVVTDLETSRSHQSPPVWIRFEDRDMTQPQVATDGGSEDV